MALVDNVWYVDFGNGTSTGYYGVTAWAIGASKVCGNLVRQLVAPSVGNERVFVCIASTSGTGTTGGSEPTWTVTRGAKNTDNTVTWQEATGIGALNGDLTNTPNWTTVKNTAITLGQVIKNNAGNLVLICTTAGTAGNGAEPSWSAFTNAGATTADNTATWTTLGASFSVWAAPHARLANAFTSTWGQAGNSFYLASEHAETQASAMILTPPSSNSAFAKIYCVDKLAVPPASANLASGATISTTGANDLSFASAPNYAYWFASALPGISFQAGDAANTASVKFGNGFGADSVYNFSNCTFTLNNTSGSSRFNLGNQGGIDTTLANCNFKFGSGTSQFMTGVAGNFRMYGGSVSVGATVIATLMQAVGLPLTFVGVDLSALVNTTLLSGSSAFVSPVPVTVQDCKLASGFTFASISQMQGVVYDIRSDSGATNYLQSKFDGRGQHVAETTITRSGGATDGTTLLSWKFVTSSRSAWVGPFQSIPISIWNATTGSAITLTIFGTWNSGAVPNSDDIWIEVEYLGASTSPLGSIVTATKANNLASGSPLTADGSTWNGGGSGGGWSPFSTSVTFTPQMAGPLMITVKAAKASSTFYIDPKPSISGVTVSKSFILAPGVYTNELSTGGAAGMLFIPNLDGV